MRRRAALIVVGAVVLLGAGLYVNSRFNAQHAATEAPGVERPIPGQEPRSDQEAPAIEPAKNNREKGSSSSISSETSAPTLEVPPTSRSASVPSSPNIRKPSAASANSESSGASTAKAFSDWFAEPGDPVMGNPVAAPHQVLQNEQADDQWSAAAAQALRNYLEDNFAGQLEFPSIDCRSDLCEIQAATLQAHQNDEVMLFQRVVNGMPQLAWWQNFEFGSPSFAVNGQDDGQTLMIVFISRKM